MSASDLSNLSLQEALAALAAREVSATALAEALLDRIAHFDPQIGAVTETLAATARREAEAADARRQSLAAASLGGVPVLVKDIIGGIL